MRPLACRTGALALVLCLAAADPALAYVGPGLGIGVIGTVIGLVMALVLAFVGLLWYPLKRVFKRKPAPAGAASATHADLAADRKRT